MTKAQSSYIANRAFYLQTVCRLASHLTTRELQIAVADVAAELDTFAKSGDVAQSGSGNSGLGYEIDRLAALRLPDTFAFKTAVSLARNENTASDVIRSNIQDIYAGVAPQRPWPQTVEEQLDPRPV